MRLVSRLAAVSLVAACAPVERVPAPAPPQPLPSSSGANSFDVPKASGQYRRVPPVTRQAVARSDPDQRYLLLSGQRLAERGGGYDVADTAGSSTLTGY